MTFEETFKNWTLDQKVEWALGHNCNLSENMRSIIVDLKTENERLKCEIWKAESKQSGYEHFLRKENEKLRCLALHLFEKVAKNEASEWSEFCDDQFPHSGIHKCKRRKEQWLRIVKKCGDEYRKAKAELKEGK